MTLDYLSYFAVVLRGIQQNANICQTNYSIPSKLEFTLIPEFIQRDKKVQVKGTLIKI